MSYYHEFIIRGYPVSYSVSEASIPLRLNADWLAFLNRRFEQQVGRAAVLPTQALCPN